jgi:hypothetical protein
VEVEEDKENENGKPDGGEVNGEKELKGIHSIE